MNCIEADNIIYLENRNDKMSDDLMSKVTELQNQVKQLENFVQGLSAQLEAHKQMLNESLNNVLQLKAHNLMVQKQLNDSMAKCNGLEKELAECKTKCETKDAPPVEPETAA